MDILCSAPDHPSPGCRPQRDTWQAEEQTLSRLLKSHPPAKASESKNKSNIHLRNLENIWKILDNTPSETCAKPSTMCFFLLLFGEPVPVGHPSERAWSLACRVSRLWRWRLARWPGTDSPRRDVPNSLDIP